MLLETVFNFHAQSGNPIFGILQNIALLTPLILFFFTLIFARTKEIWISLCLFLSFYMIWGSGSSELPVKDMYLSIAIYSQIYSALLVSKRELPIEKVIGFFSLIAIFAAIYTFLYFEFDEKKFLLRGYIWNEFFYYLPLTNFYIFGLVYWIFYRRKSSRIFLMALSALYLNLLFFKRFIIVDLALLGILIFYLGSRWVKLTFLGITLILSALVLTLPETSFMDAYVGRIEEISTKGLKLDRITESTNLLSQKSPMGFVLGEGFLKGQTAYFGRTRGAVHIGWVNIIHVMGLIGLLGLLLRWIVVLRQTYSQNDLFWLSYLTISMFRLFYINFYSMVPEIFFISYALFRSRDGK